MRIVELSLETKVIWFVLTLGAILFETKKKQAPNIDKPITIAANMLEHASFNGKT